MPTYAVRFYLYLESQRNARPRALHVDRARATDTCPICRGFDFSYATCFHSRRPGDRRSPGTDLAVMDDSSPPFFLAFLRPVRTVAPFVRPAGRPSDDAVTRMSAGQAKRTRRFPLHGAANLFGIREQRRIINNSAQTNSRFNSNDAGRFQR